MKAGTKGNASGGPDAIHGAPASSRRPGAVRNSAFNLAALVATQVAFLVTIPVIVAYLGLETYGTWVIIISLLGSFGIFVHGGLGDAVIKYVSEHASTGAHDDANHVIRTASTIALTFSLVLVAIAFLLAPFVHEFFGISTEAAAFRSAFAAYAIGMSANLLFVNTLGIFKGLERFDTASKLQIVMEATKTGGMVGVLALGHGLPALALAYMGGTVVGLVAAIAMLLGTVPWVRIGPDLRLRGFRQVFSFSSFSFVTGVSINFRANVVNLLVGRILGPATVPLFSVPYQLAAQSMSVMGAATNVLFPRFSSLAATRDIGAVQRTYHAGLRYSYYFGAAMALALIVFAHPFLTLWMDGEFADRAARNLQVMAGIFVLISGPSVSYQLLNGFGKVRVTAAIQAISLLAVSALGVLLIPIWGTLGATLAYVGVLVVLAQMYFAGRIVWAEQWLARTARGAARPFILFVALLSTVLLIGPPRTAEPFVLLVYATGLGSFGVLCLAIVEGPSVFERLLHAARPRPRREP